MDLTVFGVQQNRAAASAGIINRVIARIENGRGTHDGSNCRGGNDLQANFTVSGLFG
jgi:hypothetical protein